MSPPGFSEAAETSKAWPFEEARKLIARLERSGRKEAVFETGYGPSGLPQLARAAIGVAVFVVAALLLTRAFSRRSGGDRYRLAKPRRNRR